MDVDKMPIGFSAAGSYDIAENCRYRPEESVIQLGSNLRSARLRRRLPQSVVADRAGISLNTLSKIENGDCGVSIGNIASVLNALGLSPLLSGLAAAQEDSAGLMLEERNLPQRVRSKKKSAGQ